MAHEPSHTDAQAALDAAFRHALAYLRDLPDRPLTAEQSPAALRAALGATLTDAGEPAAAVIARLAAASAGVTPMSGPRFFSFVIGGAHPAGIAADWLAAVWDQNSGLYGPTPLSATAESIASRWVLDLLGLPQTAAVGFVTGATMANFAGLAAARRALLERAGWDVEAKGLYGAPEIAIVLGEDAHSTVFGALRFLGLGAERVHRIATDAQGRMSAPALKQRLESLGAQPTLVCAQAGQINTGACDPFGPIVEACRTRGAWLHVDGAFGLWAQASPKTRALTEGVEHADSWAVDAHKWLNTPYDCGFAIVRDPAALVGAMAITASYLQASADERNPSHYVPELSRRARGFAVYATLAALGRQGVRELVERCCALTRRMRDALAGEPGIACLNEVVLNQAIFRFGDDDALTQAVADAVTASGEAYLHTAQWRGRAVMRFSVCSHMTTEADIDRTARAVLKAFREARA
jgi:glutamate/tyrosine decarboxylase-like PLP-dependent enzyme